MRRSDHFFEDCEIGVIAGEVQDAAKPSENALVSVIRINDPAADETFYYPLTEDVRKKLIRDLSSGIHVARADEVKH